MVTASLIQTLLRQNTSTETAPRMFQPGQVFNGKILKLFPGQIAEVQIGNQKVIAQLEASLAASERYWFQVQPGEGKVHLKILQSPEGQQSRDVVAMDTLLKQLNLPPSKENGEILRFFIKEQLPITKEALQMASDLLKGANSSKEGLEVIRQLILRELPLTKDTFLAVQSNVKSEPIHTLMQHLQSLLTKDNLSETGNKLASILYQSSETEKVKFVEKAVTQLVGIWLNGKDKADTQKALNILQQFQFLPEGNEEEVVIKTALRVVSEAEEQNQAKELKGLVSRYQDSQGPLNSINKTEVISEIKKVLETLSQQSKDQVSIIGLLKKEDSNLEAFARFLNSQMSDSGQTIKLVDTNGVKPIGTEITDEEKELLQSIGRGLQEENVKWENGRSVSDQLKHLVKTLGLTHENDLLSFLKTTGGEDQPKTETLKALLVKFLNEGQSLPVKEAAEQLLHRITGVQLLSHEIGPLQQLVMQIPLSFWNKTTDLTLQWSGRKKENGQIDPNYCRVLFYLELEYLNETIVDMQVQNRILNITVINDTENIKEVGKVFLPSLKESLAGLNYQLSSISFQKTTDQSTEQNKNMMKQVYQSSNYSGVDYRV
ncbi:hypothetical protein SM124_21935 [Bacillus sp. 31A1R]|uniref:Flagellar hook-length control protein FliK n=1 Tax=Robertmurraya mangrovi TaxID=3098077 RepID=A0ABU5J4K9_9BACI|nr:hypothetical protein [Bacillus sp. 31A1R]MDZ5474358.1 hypothetical protein [Bacillus sp. 31A1R]